MKKICQQCQIAFVPNRARNKYCSMKCWEAHGRHHTEETKKRLSVIFKGIKRRRRLHGPLYEDGSFRRATRRYRKLVDIRNSKDAVDAICFSCKKAIRISEKYLKARRMPTCGDKKCVSYVLGCASRMSWLNNSPRPRNRCLRSKKEIELFDLCIAEYPDSLSNHVISDGWDADIVIPSKMTAIFWNGIWHWKQIPMKKHSLAQVQNRDRIKKALFEGLGWTVLVYEDRSFTPKSAFEDIKARLSGLASLVSLPGRKES